MKKIGLGWLFLLLMGWAQAQSAPTVIFVVRHADKALESSDNPNLSVLGQQQATRLAAILKNAGIEAVYTTATRRTHQTVNPVAEARNLPVEEYDPKDPGFAEKLRQAGKKILVVGHSYTVPELLNQLSNSQAYQPSDAQGDLWVVTLLPGQPAVVLQLNYH